MLVFNRYRVYNIIININVDINLYNIDRRTRDT